MDAGLLSDVIKSHEVTQVRNEEIDSHRRCWTRKQNQKSKLRAINLTAYSNEGTPMLLVSSNMKLRWGQ